MRTIVTAGILCASAVSTSRASPADTLDINLTVDSQERAPTQLCVLLRLECDRHRSGKACDHTTPLRSIQGLFGDRDNWPARFHAPGSSHGRDVSEEVYAALKWLAATPSELRQCSGSGYGACAPEVDLQEFYRQPASGPATSLEGQIVCSQPRMPREADSGREGPGPGEPHDERPSPQRVALLSLKFNENVVDGIDGVMLGGDLARVHLIHEKLTGGTIRVIGGDYAIAETGSSFAADRPISVSLRPRCDHFSADVPAHKAPITTVDLQVGERRYSCVPDNSKETTIPLVLPFTSADEKKSLTVTYGGGVTSEVHWSESVPPHRLRLDTHVIRFSWRRPVGCLAETWREPTPKEDKEDKEWGPGCPRAKLRIATACKLDVEAQERCRYRCEVPPTVSLPAPVTFERLRSRSGAPPEVLYSWSDSIDAVDQELTSVVPPADRRVMLEFADPAQWKDRLGDEIDEIQVRSGQSVGVIHLHDTERPPPSWVSLPSAGRTCGDRVRVAILGTWPYLEQTLEVPEGRIELSRPYKYRKATSFYGLAGAGELVRHLGSNSRSATFADLGFGLQIDLAGVLRSLVLDVEATGQLTHTFYEGIELSKPQPQADFTAVPYLRFDLRVAVEWWWRRRVGVAAAGGVGFGTPLYADDARMVGALRRSEVFELQPAIFALLPTRLWFLAGVGGRFGEQHRDYRTDFLGSPTPDQERDSQWYVFLRFRAALD